MGLTAQTKVMLVDDHEIMRDGLGKSSNEPEISRSLAKPEMARRR